MLSWVYSSNEENKQGEKWITSYKKSNQAYIIKSSEKYDSKIQTEI